MLNITPLDELFGTVIPAGLGVPTQVELIVQEREHPIPSIITLRIEESTGRLIADFLCIEETKDYDKEEESGFADEPIHTMYKTFRKRQTVTIRFWSRERSQPELRAEVTGVNIFGAGVSGETRGSLMITQREVKTAEDAITTGKLTIPDFPRFTGRNRATTTVETTYGYNRDWPEWRLIGYVQASVQDWEVSILERNDQSRWGYSHEVTVHKTAGAEFSTDELMEFIGTFSHFLGLVTGTIRWPTASTGYRDAFPVWGWLGIFKQNAYTPDNWFSDINGDAIAELLPLYWERHRTSGEAMDRQIELYGESSIIAHAGLHRHALAISQSALEHIVEEEVGKRPPRTYTSTHIERALKQIGIDTAITAFPEVRNAWDNIKAPDDNNDGPTFITRLRNSIHPRNTANAPQPQAEDFYNAWRLSQYYVETALLRLCGYNGRFRNRMTAKTTTDIETVPWADKSTK